MGGGVYVNWFLSNLSIKLELYFHKILPFK